MSEGNGFATRDDFFAATKRRYKEVPLWTGKKARIRSIFENEFQEIDVRNIDFRKGGLSAVGIRSSNARLIVLTVCDGQGEPLFTEQDRRFPAWTRPWWSLWSVRFASIAACGKTRMNS